MNSVEVSFSGHSKSCCFLYTSGAVPSRGLRPGCSLEPACLSLFLSLPSFKFFLIYRLSKAFPASFCLKLHLSCWLAFSVSLLCFVFLCANYHLITCYVIYLLFVAYLPQMQHKLYEGKDFCLCCSLLYPQSLTARKCSGNICWVHSIYL